MFVSEPDTQSHCECGPSQDIAAIVCGHGLRMSDASGILARSGKQLSEAQASPGEIPVSFPVFLFQRLFNNAFNVLGCVMDKWTELRKTIQELCDNNAGIVHAVLYYLLNLMDVLDSKEE